VGLGFDLAAGVGWVWAWVVGLGRMGTGNAGGFGLRGFGF
jgi:hypothetical protein